MQFHELANVFPLIEGDEFAGLVADIGKQGLLEAIVLLDGKILDGRNRYRACLEAGVEPHFEEFDGEDPVAFVVSKNVARRHLDESQRAMAAARIATLQNGQRKSASPIGEGRSQAEAAQILNVGKRSVERARDVLDQGEATLVKAVEQGKVSVSAAADVATLPKQEQAEIVAKGEKEILEAAKRIRAKKSEAKREERIERIAEIAVGNRDLNTGKTYPVVYADPPWQYDYSPTEVRAIENHYPTMSLEQIKALPISNIVSDDAILFMWATSPKLKEAFQVLEAWGFEYRSSAIWVKNQLGMGYYFRQQHELLLIATRGSMPAPAPADRPRSVFTSDRTEHSAKPAEFADFIERMYPTLPRIELFCRSPRHGWDVWGNQAHAA
jgi:N6-adenosine-specific RNA methylase IME4/ParB-like chromosome segregation protein Spo0J